MEYSWLNMIGLNLTRIHVWKTMHCNIHEWFLKYSKKKESRSITFYCANTATIPTWILTAFKETHDRRQQCKQDFFKGLHSFGSKWSVFFFFGFDFDLCLFSYEYLSIWLTSQQQRHQDQQTHDFIHWSIDSYLGLKNLMHCECEDTLSENQNTQKSYHAQTGSHNQECKVWQGIKIVTAGMLYPACHWNEHLQKLYKLTARRERNMKL